MLDGSIKKQNRAICLQRILVYSTHLRIFLSFYCLSSVEGEAPSSETGTSLDSPSAYHQGPITHSSAISPDHYEHSAYGLYSVSPGQQRSRRPKLQHSTSILRKQAEEEAIKRSRSLSESYELSSDLQDKQVFELFLLLLLFLTSFMTMSMCLSAGKKIFLQHHFS